MNQNKIVKKSIQNEISKQFSILLITMITIIIFVMGYLFISSTKNNAQNIFENKAISIQNKIEERILYLKEMTELLSKNSLMINSLIDDYSKQEYLTPLANNFMEDKNVNYLNIVDFDGKIIFKTNDNILTYNESKYLRNALSFGNSVYFIDEKTKDLTIISPIKYYATTQGALIATFNLNNIGKKYTILTSSEYLDLKYKNTSIYKSTQIEDQSYYSFVLQPLDGSLFKELNLNLEIGQLKSIFLAPVKDAIVKLIGLTIFLVLIGILISQYLIKKITTPILKLYNNVKSSSFNNDYIPLGTNDELEELSKAFYDKTKKLYESQYLLQTVINSIDDLIFFKDKDFKFIGCNKAFLKLLGENSVEEIKGKTDYDYFDKKIADFFREMDKNMLIKNEKRFNNEWLTYPDGKKVYTQVLKSPFFYAEDKIGVLGISRDITELYKLQEEELKNQKIMAQQSKMASMGEMIANIAHQWRQPLSAISTIATGMKVNLEFGLPLTEEQIIQNCDSINENSQYLSKTIDDFKNFSKGDRVKKEFEISKEINSFISLIQGSVKSNYINLICNLDDSIKLEGYPHELIQCFVNIFNNSKDAFKDNNSQNRYFFIETKIKDENLLIVFKDSAGGIPENVIPKIFDPYFTTKNPSKGTGLGLSMTYKLITEGMKGSIEARNCNYSYEGKDLDGAEFLIELPLK